MATTRPAPVTFNLKSLDHLILEGLKTIADDLEYDWFKDNSSQWNLYKTTFIRNALRHTIDLPSYFPRGKWPTLEIFDNWIDAHQVQR